MLVDTYRLDAATAALGKRRPLGRKGARAWRERALRLAALRADYDAAVLVRVPDGFPALGGTQVSLAAAHRVLIQAMVAGVASHHVLRLANAVTYAGETKLDLPCDASLFDAPPLPTRKPRRRTR